MPDSSTPPPTLMPSAATESPTEVAPAITVWIAWVPPQKTKQGLVLKPGYWSFNHIEEGHSQADKPVDRFGVGWKSGTWRKRHATLITAGSRFGAPVVQWNAQDAYAID